MLEAALVRCAASGPSPDSFSHHNALDIGMELYIFENNTPSDKATMSIARMKFSGVFEVENEKNWLAGLPHVGQHVLYDSRFSSSLSAPSILHGMASTERYRHGSLKQSSSFYPPPPPPPESQTIWRSDQDPIFHPTALDRFEEQWRSSQGRVVPDENIPSPVRLDFERIRSPAASPPPSANAPFYVPRRYESPAYPQQDREDMMMSTGPEPVRREQMYVQVNQASRTPNVRPPIPLYQPWQHPSDMDRQSAHSLPPYDHHQPSYERPVAPRPATMPPQYRQQPQPRHPRPDSRSRRHNPYAHSESRRRRRSSSSQARHPSKRRFTPPQHYQRQFPSRPPLL
ncbi:uncharacterized protein PAC_05423 [Phialocephala subalpina]|uniref:Uncharacterized protein n=1 Tax=Phialocephala subalpina TaxID=576137 RepID=A0A1L7WS17_9HELO|nr:uncharacterized protein PAC_05423 [Phialocephala subalpina]